MFAYDVVKKFSRKPSEYFSTNCFAATFLTDLDRDACAVLGADRIMWGADYPHHEGVFPHVDEALRANFAGMAEQDVRMMTSLSR